MSQTDKNEALWSLGTATKRLNFIALQEKLQLQKGRWRFLEPPVVAGFEDDKRILFTVESLVIQEDEYGFGNFIAANGKTTTADGTVLSPRWSDNIYEDFLPSEFIYLASLIPDEYVDLDENENAWEDIPETVQVHSIENKVDIVRFSKKDRTIEVDGNKFSGEKAFWHLSDILKIKKSLNSSWETVVQNNIWETAVQQWYENNNFDLPF